MSALTAVHDEAIAAALSQNWEQAVILNQQIVNDDPVNIDGLNRLAFACTQLGKTKEAKSHYEKVLEIDPYNQIAQKNLTKLKAKNGTTTTTGAKISPLMFLEEPGKTKIVSCINLAPNDILDQLWCGQEVKLKVKKHVIEIRDDQNVYIAALPDDVSFKLSRFITAGNQYQTLIRSVGKNQLTVFMRELSRGKGLGSQPSFTSQSTFVAQGRYEDGAERPDTQATGETEGESEE